jgi:vacuolar iron transporter family protein
MLSPSSAKHPYKPFTDIVIGISDGLIIPFAITTGLSVITPSNELILQAGLIAIVAGAIIMGLGGYFAAKGRQESFAKKTATEEEKIKKEELERTLHLFKQLDFGKEMQDEAATIIENDSNEWKAYLEKHLPELEISDTGQLPKTALLIGLSYAVGGLVPLLPYLYFTDKKEALVISSIATIIALLIFGYIKSKVNKEPILWGTLRLMLLGVVAAGAAFAVASIFMR